MSIYTKTGDTGTTATFGGKRVDKFDPQIEACGALDETTSFIGLIIAIIDDTDDIQILSDIQEDLYTIMGFLADAPLHEDFLTKRISLFEKRIDTLEKTLPKLTRFILPQGGEISARIHVSRAVTRSAERRVVAYIKGRPQKSDDVYVMQYLNRLSDFLFMMARKYSEKEVLT